LLDFFLFVHLRPRVCPFPRPICSALGGAAFPWILLAVVFISACGWQRVYQQIGVVSPYFLFFTPGYLGAELISPHLSAAFGRIPCPDSGGNQCFCRLLPAPIWA
jgi:hypothetical protein